MNKRGQALIEFVLILPIFLFLIMAVVDFGMIFNKRNAIETVSSDIILLYKDKTNIDAIRNLYPKYVIEVNSEGEYDKITITGNVKLNTPGFNRIFGNPYKIQVERYLRHEQ